MYPAFFYAPRKPPAGRVGGVSHTPPTRPGIWGECVFLVLKHRFIVIQVPFKRHSNSVLRAVGEGHQGCLPSWPGTSGTPAKLAGYIKRVPGFLRRPPASAEAGKLAGYLKSPYQANFAGVRRCPPASADAPRGESEARAGTTATARSAAPRSAAIAVAVAAAPQIVTAVR